MLDERKSAILRAVIEEYIETAQPVGSSHVSRKKGVDVSSATVRNEMVALEQEGFLQQPHTSAGRVPTDKGYRYYVDAFAEPAKLRQATSQEVRAFFDKAHGELERLMADTSNLLSRLTSYAGVVVPPSAETATVRSVQVVGLSATTALLVVVLSNGTVVKHTIEHGPEVDDAGLEQATATLAAGLHGSTLAARPATKPTGRAAVDALVGSCLDALDEHNSVEGPVFLGGASRMAQAFDAVDTVRSVLTTLEEQYVVVTLLRDVLARGDQVAIGSEHGVEPLRECSVVVAPYSVEGRPAGTIAVLGPTRMHYPEALAAVAMVSQRLGQRLSEG